MKKKKTVGQRIMEAREFMGLTRAELAEKAKVRHATLYQYEIDKVTPKLAPAARIAYVLGVSVDWIAMGCEDDE
jgi:DNA-binding XRE family transcriptional regulator